MPDYDLDQINAAFAGFRSEAAGHVRPAGIDSARAVARHRRTVRTVALSAAAVVLIVAPLAAYAAYDRGKHDAPVGGGASPSASAERSATPTATPPVRALPRPLCEDAALPTTQPQGSTPPGGPCALNIPAWPTAVPSPGPNFSRCRSGPVTFNGAGNEAAYSIADSFHMYIPGLLPPRSTPDPAHVDVDGDGTVETIVRIDCGTEIWISQIVAFGRAADGKIRTVGRVMATDNSAQCVLDWQGTPDGKVRVEVCDVTRGLDERYLTAKRQWRTYAWDGQRFSQVDGPTTF